MGMAIALFACLQTAQPVNAQRNGMQMDFAANAQQAGNATAWKMINWQPDMARAKAVSAQQHKPILVVIHNNHGGDVNSGEC